MTWQIKVSTKAIKMLAKIETKNRDKIWHYIKNTLPEMDNPRLTGKALQGNKKGLWRYRVGDYRLICQIQDSELIVVVIEIGHRKNVYQ